MRLSARKAKANGHQRPSGTARSSELREHPWDEVRIPNRKVLDVCDLSKHAEEVKKELISVVIPVYNEVDLIPSLYRRINNCASEWGEDFEIIVVDDGSTDETLAALESACRADMCWKVVVLTRNFGHQAAITAGLQHARGDLVAIIDGDLQDPPEELVHLFEKARRGFDVVYGVRTRRKEGLLKRASYSAFYRILGRMAEIKIPLDAGDFCVMRRGAVDRLNALPETARFVRGLRSWIGGSQVGHVYERQARAAGSPKYNLRKLLDLAASGFVDFSIYPLIVVTKIGFALILLSIFLSSIVVVQYSLNLSILQYNPRHAPGWTSLMLVVLMMGSAQLFALGIIGQYLARIFVEAKRRPNYQVARHINFENLSESRDLSRKVEA